MKIIKLITLTIKLVSPILAGCALLSGCATRHADQVSTNTDIRVGDRPFTVIKAGAVGTSYGFKLLGIIPFANPHSATAQQSLYASVSEPITHKSVTLINQKEDSSTIYLILFSIPKVTLTGDVIEFTEGARNNQ